MDTNKHHCFILSELIIYLCFLAGDLFAYDTSLIKYAGIVLCFVRAVYKRNRIIALAFGLTMISDFFLLLLDRYYTTGVCFFVLVQMTYLYYLHRQRCRPYLVPRGVLFAVGAILLFVNRQTDALSVVTLFYFVNLLGNTMSSFSNPELKMMSLGFVLFVCCDICVGLHNLLPYGRLYDVVSFCMWLFYLPSQILICLGSENALRK